MNNLIKTTVGKKSDFVHVPFQNGDNTLYGYMKTSYYHVHGKSFLYPDKANPVTLTSSAPAWSETGNITEIIPAGAITRDFDLHWVNISDMPANLYGVVDIFAGAVGQEVKIGSVDCVRTSNFSQEGNRPVQIPQLKAGTRVSCRFSDSTTSARSVTVKFYGHLYGETA